MSILVTGAAGFIGYHLSKSLLDDGYEVIGLDNFNDYYSVQLKEDRWSQLEDYEKFTGYRADLSDPIAMTSLFKKHDFETVCNLAAQAGVRYSIEHPEVYMKSNLVGFLHVLEACRFHGKPRLVYASSSSVYGGNTKIPFSEDDRVDHPISLYAASKKSNELMAHTYSHLYDMQTIGLRFFTVYGPWGRPDMAMWLFADAMLSGRPINVFNHGKMRRDFTYVADIVSGIKASLFNDNLSSCEIFNLGNHRSENLMDMIQLLSDNLGVKPEMNLLPMQPGDVPETCADIHRAQTKLNFQPKTSVASGIPAFINWYRSYHNS